MRCPVSLTIMTFKKLVHLKYELSSHDNFVHFFYQNYLLDDHLTIMDVVYMFDWKRVITFIHLIISFSIYFNFQVIHFTFNFLERSSYNCISNSKS